MFSNGIIDEAPDIFFFVERAKGTCFVGILKEVVGGLLDGGSDG